MRVGAFLSPFPRGKKKGLLNVGAGCCAAYHFVHIQRVVSVHIKKIEDGLDTNGKEQVDIKKGRKSLSTHCWYYCVGQAGWMPRETGCSCISSNGFGLQMQDA